MPSSAVKGEESAYARSQRFLRAEEKRKARRGQKSLARKAGEARVGTASTGDPKKDGVKSKSSVRAVYCNAQKRDGSRCRQAAGYGTSHSGFGACKFHGGNYPSHQVSHAKRQAVTAAVVLGAPKEINPLDAIIWCIQIKSGEVEWLSEKIADLTMAEAVEETIVGKQFHLYVRARNVAMKDLVEFSSHAIRLGLAERAVKLAEQYGEMLARLIGGILGDLQLTPEQAQRAPDIVRRHLILVNGGLAAGELPAGTEGIAS